MELKDAEEAASGFDMGGGAASVGHVHHLGWPPASSPSCSHAEDLVLVNVYQCKAGCNKTEQLRGRGSCRHLPHTSPPSGLASGLPSLVLTCRGASLRTCCWRTSTSARRAAAGGSSAAGGAWAATSRALPSSC
jgi:hypothetical protein